MGVLKVNGVDIRDYATAVSDLQGRTESVLTSSDRFKNVYITESETTSNSTKMLSTAWGHDVFESKLKLNGVNVTVAYDGTRPINKSTGFYSTMGIAGKGAINDCYAMGCTYRLVNENGKLNIYQYVSSSTVTSGPEITSSDRLTYENIVISKHPNKIIVINIMMTGGGGAGGCGAYFFLRGDFGGVGGGSGARSFFTLTLNNGDAYIIYSPYAGTISGTAYNVGGVVDNTNQFSNSQLCAIRKLNSSSDFIVCNGGINGVSYKGVNSDSSISTMSPFYSSTLPTGVVLRKKANGQRKALNGNGLNSVAFTNVTAPYYGNPENIKGDLIETASGGTAQSSEQKTGSGGAAGYGAGGAGGTSSSEDGVAGGIGAGGGGAYANFTENHGGRGGSPGFIIFY